MPSRIAILIAVAASLSCARTQPVPIVVEVGAANRGQLLQLRPGMTRADVLQSMGIELAERYSSRDRGFDTVVDEDALIPNPYRTAQIRTDDGSDVELLFYYTGTNIRDEAVSDDDLTPLVLENGLLVGWGWTYLDQNVQEYRFLVRRR
jgi:hypothetical protein